MSEYLLQTYRPVADALLLRHALQVSTEARDTLAKTILRARVLPPDQKTGATRETIALRSALKHALGVQRQIETPSVRADRILARRIKLADALSRPLIQFSLGVAGIDPLLVAKLRCSETMAVDVQGLIAALRAMLNQRESKTADGGAKGGRPEAYSTRIISTGMFVWKLAGREGNEYVWRSDLEELTGALPAFLRELMASCRGGVKHMRGYTLHLTDKALHHVVTARQRVTDARIKQFRARGQSVQKSPTFGA